jgi:hypothetical protein
MVWPQPLRPGPVKQNLAKTPAPMYAAEIGAEARLVSGTLQKTKRPTSYGEEGSNLESMKPQLYPSLIARTLSPESKKYIKISRWLRNTGVFERARVAQKARETERQSLGRLGSAKPLPWLEPRMPVLCRSTFCCGSSGTRRLRWGAA